MDRLIDSIVVHCADTREDDPATPKNEEMDIGVVEIEAWHKERALKEPWSKYIDEAGEEKFIGYHYVVRRNGKIEAGRPVHIVGCHTAGFNQKSIGICWVGRHSMSAAQRYALVDLCAATAIYHGLDSIDIYAHNQFNSKKTCPNFDSKDTFESIGHFRAAVEGRMEDIK